MKTGNFTDNGNQIATAGNAGVLNTLYVWGTFGGGTLTLDCTPDGAEFFDIIDPETDEEVAITEKSAIALKVKTRMFRVTLTGATDPDLKWAIL